MPAGRPTIYSEELIQEICTRIQEGHLLNKICRDPEMPAKTTVFRWLREYPEFRELYTQAREDQAYGWVEECFDIADESEYDMTEDEDGKPIVNWEHLNRSRLRIDTRKWAATKIAAKIFGDKVRQEHTGADGKDLNLNPVALPPQLSREEWLKTYAQGMPEPEE